MAPSIGDSPSLYFWRGGDSAHYRAGGCARKCDHVFVANAARTLGVNMFFPISGAHISPIYLVIVGFFIGILGGFFGVGGSSLPDRPCAPSDWIGTSPLEQIWPTSSANRWWRQN